MKTCTTVNRYPISQAIRVWACKNNARIGLREECRMKSNEFNTCLRIQRCCAAHQERKQWAPHHRYAPPKAFWLQYQPRHLRFLESKRKAGMPLQRVATYGTSPFTPNPSGRVTGPKDDGLPIGRVSNGPRSTSPSSGLPTVALASASQTRMAEPLDPVTIWRRMGEIGPISVSNPFQWRRWP